MNLSGRLTLKFLTPPTADAPKNVLADFVELECWKMGSMSATALSRLLGRLEENDYSRGVPEEENRDVWVEETFEEIERRREACRGSYPFEFVHGENTIRAAPSPERPTHAIYKYLLLSTRLNMTESRFHAGIDGTQLLENLSAQVAKKYFGERAESIVFGTAEGDTGFKEKVENLCRNLGEGGGFKQTRTNARDGKLDIVVWKPFADGLAGKLIGFGQCKTGTHYKDSLTELQPDGFIRKWIREPVVVPPVRMFFISEALSTTSSERYEDSVDAGLLFDRCRIVDFCDGVDDELLATLRKWTAAAAAANELPGL